MRTILNDIMPFMGAMGSVEIVSFSNIDEISEEYQNRIFLYFVSGDIVCENLQFFSQIARRCIILNEGEEFSHKEFKYINILLPERELIKSLLMIHNHTHHSHSLHHHTEKPKEESLSIREKEVLELIVKGYINKEIADRLNISTSTVIFHRKNICERVGSKSIGRLTIYAVMNGIVDLREL
ncbi:MAG: helix-turn-helix transcriptional regulator [Bacteroidales bacterium]|nr:helix-turn-helix transcriptional regulator [Bacteroidales bacterium]